MVRGSRIAYGVLAWLFVVGVVAQVFFIGLGLFADPGAVEIHRNLGWLLHMWPVLILLFAVLARAGSRHWQWALALAIVVFLVPLFVTLRASLPAVAALHPVGAMAAFALAIVVAINGTRAMREPSEQPGLPSRA